MGSVGSSPASIDTPVPRGKNAGAHRGGEVARIRGMSAIPAPQGYPPDAARIRLATTTSTNDLAKAAIQAGEASGVSVWVAATQTGGRGRRGRRWEAPKGGLWLTGAWPLASEACLAGLGLRAGVGVCDALREFIGDRACLKWPNDVLIDGRKVAGILCESVPDPGGSRWAVIGVGVNANNDPGGLPDGLRRSPTALREELGREVDLHDLEERVLRSLAGVVGIEGTPRAIIDRAQAMLFGIGEPLESVDARGECYAGLLLGLAPDGRLLLESDGERICVPLDAEPA